MHGVLELAHVAPPSMAPKLLARRVRERQRRYAIGVGIFGGEVLGQELDVLGPVSQGRNLDVDHVEPVEQILPHGAIADGLLEVAVGGGDQPDVHFDRLGAADPVDLAFLDDPQKLGLEMRVHLADLIEKQGAAIGFLEFADPPRHRSGKSALLVAEKL